ncbi:MAG: glycosyltransferase [bacterium]|nr:glycosyltransferase [bacterium]
MVMKQSVSLCMIVKNEERNLSRCLDSFKDLVDEIIIVDTGSSDKTVEVAKSYGAKTYYFKWCDDFSAARNESLKYATKEWILSIDADEYIDLGNKDKIRQILKNPVCNAYSINIKNFLAPHSPIFAINSLTRLYKNIPGISYNGKIHNQIEPSIKELGMEIGTTNIFIYHTGYLAKDKGDSGRLNILKECYNKTPTDPLINFYLGEKYESMSSYDSAIEHFKKAVASKISAIFLPGMLHIIDIYNKKGLPEEALKWFRKTLKVYPDDFMLHIMASQSYNLKKEYLESIRELRNGMKKLDKVNAGSLFNMEVSPSVIYEMTGGNYECLGIIEKAIFYYKKAIEVTPDYLTPYLKLVKLYEEKSEIDNAIEYLQKAIEIEPSSSLSLHLERVIALKKK